MALEHAFKHNQSTALPEPPSHIVGVGASAGGLEALEELFKAMPQNLNIAFVVVQHLSADSKSLMVDLFRKYTSMKVVAVNQRTLCEKNTVYLVPAKTQMLIEGSMLVPHDQRNETKFNYPINSFFKCLAATWGARSMAIILSGTGTDGTAGAASIHETSGVVIAQLPESCKFEGMPQSAIQAGVVDAVLRPKEIPSLLSSLVSTPTELLLEDGQAPSTYGLDQLQRILEVLRTEYKTNFEHYKPGTILRRLHRRANLRGCASNLDEYSKLLSHDPSELEQLYHDLLIGVTCFFRDEDAFDVLEKHTLPDLLDNIAGNEEIRIWVCGCSTGEEAYSIAMLVMDALETRNLRNSVKIFASDLHAGALQVATEGLYEASKLQHIPNRLRTKYFDVEHTGFYKATPALRKLIIFCEHNVLTNPPFTKMHMVTCRNLLIYLSVEAQLLAITSFNFALNQGGILFLGASETLGDLGGDFDVVDRHWRIYRKVRESHLRDALRNTNVSGKLTSNETSRMSKNKENALSRLYNFLLDRYIPSGLLLSDNFELLHVFGDAQHFMKPPSGKVTREVFPLLDSALSIAISTGLNSTKEHRGKMVYQGIKLDKFDKSIDVIIEPLYDKVSQLHFFMVLLQEQSEASTPVPTQAGVTSHSLSEETEVYIRSLQLELQRTKEALQSNTEELETSHEELQATNEELLASNEELQSTNAELHSVNEELYTVNSEHEHKILELDRVSSDLRNLVNSAEVPTILLDTELRIRIFTPAISEIFHITSRDAGRDLRHFMPTINDPTLFKDLEETLSNRQTLTNVIRVNGGEQKFWARQCRLFSNNNTEENGVLLSYTDVTEKENLRLLNVALTLAVEFCCTNFCVLNDRFELIHNHWNNEAHPNLNDWKPGIDLPNFCKQREIHINDALGTLNPGKADIQTVKWPNNSPATELLFRGVCTPNATGWLLFTKNYR